MLKCSKLILRSTLIFVSYILRLSCNESREQPKLEKCTGCSTCHTMSSRPSEAFILTHARKRVVIWLSSVRKLHLPRFSATSGKSFAGLETLFPGQTDLALTNVQTEGSSCEDSPWKVLFLLLGSRFSDRSDLAI